MYMYFISKTWQGMHELKSLQGFGKSLFRSKNAHLMDYNIGI